MAKTPEEIEQFLEMNDVNFENIATSQSFKTNILIVKRNFTKLTVYLSVTLSFIKNLYQIINIPAIVEAVLSQIETAKTVLTINSTLVVGNSITQQIGTRIFRIERINDYQVKITLDNGVVPWNVDNIMCTIKDFNGHIVYPTVITTNNQIHIYFNDIIGSNYSVILL